MAHESDDHADREAGDDRLSAGERDERRAVHPYRDGRDALLARRRARQRELERAEQAAQERDRLRRELDAIDDALREPASVLETIAMKTPCRARWEDMPGDDAVRRCARCHRDVHDLSRMTEAEIEALFARAAASPCVRLRRRPDGRVVTADCPVEPPSLVARGARIIAAGMLFGGAAGVTATLAQPGVLIPAVASEPLEALPPPPRRPVPTVDVDALRSTEASPDDDGITRGRTRVPAGPAPAIPTADLDRHVRWIAPQAWEVDRALIDRAIDATSPTARFVRAVPRDGGIAVYGVRRASLLGRLGIQNGDVLVSVNGRSLASPAGAVEAYAALRHERAFFVRLARRGEERLHVYRITP